MRVEGTLAINASRDRVWGFLTDPEKVVRCAPGVQSIEIVSPGERFRAVASVGFGSLKATFMADAEWLDLDPPNRARMKVHATTPGSAVDLTSEMTLSDGPSGSTELGWRADVSVVGTIASVAARLLDSVSQRVTTDFFDAMRARVEETRGEGWFGPVPLEQAEGKVLGHNVSAPEGRPLLRKGRPLTARDVAALRGMGWRNVYVAQPGPDDVDEDTAAGHVAAAAAGEGLRPTSAASGRVNLLATVPGVFRADPERVAAVNGGEGITLAVLRSHSVVRSGQVVATVKVIPFFVPGSIVQEAERIAASDRPLLHVDALMPVAVGLILSGAPAVGERVRRDFEPPLRERIEALGSSLAATEFIALDQGQGEEALAEALRRQADAGVRLIILAGETAIVDRHDIAPRAVERAGGEVAAFGAPVDPGNLLLIAYLGEVAVLGVPGCARSRRTNVIDWVLPRLLAGERLGRADLVAMGHGGLLEDVRERPMPRNDLV